MIGYNILYTLLFIRVPIILRNGPIRWTKPIETPIVSGTNKRINPGDLISFLYSHNRQLHLLTSIIQTHHVQTNHFQ